MSELLCRHCGAINEVPGDDPDLDGTDGAHPAWWRGQDDAIDKVYLKFLAAITPGADDGKHVLSHPGLERIRRWILEHR